MTLQPINYCRDCGRAEPCYCPSWHFANERFNRSPQEPVVQQSETIAFSVDEWRAFAEIMNDLTWGKACMDKWHRRVREPMEAKAKQVEHDAKRAADC